MIQYFCDRCNEKIAGWMTAELSIESEVQYMQGIVMPIHLCPKCTEALLEWVDNKEESGYNARKNRGGK